MCDTPSHSIHSHYYRKIMDAPWAFKLVKIRLLARRFYCRNEACERKVFTERFKQELDSYARRTQRVNSCLEALGYSVGGVVGALLSKKFGMSVSPSTIIRIITKKLSPSFETPRVLGVDDWAFRKGKTYGTILVDLEKNKPIDLLPDRKAESLADWLKAHPGVEIISRDRANGYASGAKEGAPLATQVADRWHLLKNMREELQKALKADSRLIKEVSIKIEETRLSEKEEMAAGQAFVQAGNPSFLPEEKPHKEYQKAEKTQREITFETVTTLKAAGKKVTHIAQEVGISRKTVYQYLRSDFCPSTQSRTTMLMPYLEYLSRRLGSPGMSKKDLWKEIAGKGYKGSYRGFCHTLCSYFPEQKGKTKNPIAPPLFKKYSAKNLSFWLLEEPEKLPAEVLEFSLKLYESSPQIQVITSFIGQFFKMVRKRDSEAFDPWLEKLAESQIPLMINLAQRIRKDYDAIKAALSMEWSNGQVEGQVNRLKLIKRQMYGRGGFELLKRKVLYRIRDE